MSILWTGSFNTIWTDKSGIQKGMLNLATRHFNSGPLPAASKLALRSSQLDFKENHKCFNFIISSRVCFAISQHDVGNLQGVLTVSKRQVWTLPQPSVVPSHCKAFRDPPDTSADLRKFYAFRGRWSRVCIRSPLQEGFRHSVAFVCVNRELSCSWESR